ncbi:MAG TPA: hypothetical protein VF405_08295 [Gammaproteobacteria bacterium]
MLAALSLAALAAVPHVMAETRVEVLGTEPASRTVTLGSGETFYLRIAYATDTPVRIWARPYFEGREVNAGSNPSRLHEGKGETLAWFFFLGEAGQQVDEIRITAGDGSKTGTREITRLPVRITAGPKSAMSATSAPAWLAQLKSEEERLQREDYDRRMSEPLSAGDGLLAAGFMLAVLAIGIGGVALPLRAVRRWQGGWRLAAALPALWVGFVALRIVVGAALDPTSHNLWPFEILQASVASLVLTAAMTLGRRIFGR